jgi:hypothetical protein
MKIPYSPPPIHLNSRLRSISSLTTSVTTMKKISIGSSALSLSNIAISTRYESLPYYSSDHDQQVSDYLLSYSSIYSEKKIA